MIRNDIVSLILAHVDREGSGYNNWYCGIASNPIDRMFNEHFVPRWDAWWIHRNAGNEQDARDTEAYLLELGFEGGGGGGNYSAIHVYSYKKLPVTVE